jgi:hypothetical protein
VKEDAVRLVKFMNAPSCHEYSFFNDRQMPCQRLLGCRWENHSMFGGRCSGTPLTLYDNYGLTIGDASNCSDYTSFFDNAASCDSLVGCSWQKGEWIGGTCIGTPVEVNADVLFEGFFKLLSVLALVALLASCCCCCSMRILPASVVGLGAVALKLYWVAAATVAMVLAFRMLQRHFEAEDSRRRQADSEQRRSQGVKAEEQRPKFLEEEICRNELEARRKQQEAEQLRASQGA